MASTVCGQEARDNEIEANVVAIVVIVFVVVVVVMVVLCMRNVTGKTHQSFARPHRPQAHVICCRCSKTAAVTTLHRTFKTYWTEQLLAQQWFWRHHICSAVTSLTED